MYNSFISFLPQCFPSHVQFFNDLPLVFCINFELYSFTLLCKLSYLDQFYSFTIVILLYHSYHNFPRSHVQIFNVFSLCIFTEKIFCTFFTNLVIYANFKALHLQFFYIIFTTMFIGDTC